MLLIYIYIYTCMSSKWQLAELRSGSVKVTARLEHSACAWSYLSYAGWQNTHNSEPFAFDGEVLKYGNQFGFIQQ